MAVLRPVLLVILCLTLMVYSLDRQNNIQLPVPQANEIWHNRDILGDSTQFVYPLDAGTATSCDLENMMKVYEANFTLTSDYSVFDDHWSIAERGTKYYLYGYAVRDNTEASRRIGENVYDRRGCILACLNEKDFECRAVDFYWGDGGVCTLFNVSGQIHHDKPNYVSKHNGADHYKIYKEDEVKPYCNTTGDQQAHHYFALGWKAMEAGWFSLARNQFQEAINLDADFYFAYIGKILSNPDMGYGGDDTDIGNYKEVLDDLQHRLDLPVRLSYQQLQEFTAIHALLNGTDYEDGLKRMKAVFDEDTKTVADYIGRTLRGNNLLLLSDSHETLSNVANGGKVFALQYLTHNLNPYKNPRRTTPILSKAAKDAVFIYRSLEIVGSWQITADSVDIAEYYHEWALGKSQLSQQRNFLFRNTGPKDSEYLFYEDDTNLILNGLDVIYMSKSLQRINSYERLHFFELQLGQFHEAHDYLEGRKNDSKTHTELQLKNLKLRMAANAYFSSYGEVYDEYASGIDFVHDWKNPVAEDVDSLTLISRVYYWTAAAVQAIRAGRKPIYGPIITKMENMHSRVESPYKEAVKMYFSIVRGTQALSNKNWKGAMVEAKKAETHQKAIVGADWSDSNNEESAEFRMLIPLGYEFAADIYNKIFETPEAVSALKKAAPDMEIVVEAYRMATSTPPLDTSRALRSLASVLEKQFKSKPPKANDDTPEYVTKFEQLVKTWETSDIPEEKFTTKQAVQDSIEEYYGSNLSGCEADKFQVMAGGVMCWGGYVIIGVVVGLVVVIAIIVGILCLRRQAAAPRKDKDKRGAFTFTGPDLSRRGSAGSPSYTLGSNYRTSVSTLDRPSDVTPYKINHFRSRSVDASANSDTTEVVSPHPGEDVFHAEAAM